MDTQELKKFLAGLGIAGLLAGTTLMAGSGSAMGGGTGDKESGSKQAPAKGS